MNMEPLKPIPFNHPSISASYVGALLHPEDFKHTLKALVEAAMVIWYHRPFDAIAFMGMSGALIGPALASELGLGIIMVRKADDGSHSGLRVEGCKTAKRFLVVDDLVSSGRTIDRILTSIEGWMFGRDMECVGVLEYASARCGTGTARTTSHDYRPIDVFDAYDLLDPENVPHALELVMREPASHKLPPPKPIEQYNQALDLEINRSLIVDIPVRRTPLPQMLWFDEIPVPMPKLYKPVKKVSSGIPFKAKEHEATQKGSNGKLPQSMDNWREFAKTPSFLLELNRNMFLNIQAQA